MRCFWLPAQISRFFLYFSFAKDIRYYIMHHPGSSSLPRIMGTAVTANESGRIQISGIQTLQEGNSIFDQYPLPGIKFNINWNDQFLGIIPLTIADKFKKYALMRSMLVYDHQTVLCFGKIYKLSTCPSIFTSASQSEYSPCPLFLIVSIFFLCLSSTF